MPSFSDVNSGTGELLLEVHDRATKRFLGLGIVGMEELLINPNQRQTITLQPKPYETDNVSGTLTVEVSSKKFEKYPKKIETIARNILGEYSGNPKENSNEKSKK